MNISIFDVNYIIYINVNNEILWVMVILYNIEIFVIIIIWFFVRIVGLEYLGWKNLFCVIYR